jgi:hypothetical protein
MTERTSRTANAGLALNPDLPLDSATSRRSFKIVVVYPWRTGVKIAAAPAIRAEPLRPPDPPAIERHNVLLVKR